MEVTAPRSRFMALDGWRGICALLVALLHIPIKDSILGATFFQNAGLLVDFFFVLSGFVIAHAYGGLALRKPGGLLDFVLRRFGRVWPLHVVIFGFFLSINIVRIALLGWYGSAQDPGAGFPALVIAALQQVFLLQTAFARPDVYVNVPSWSIAVEFWTYILFGLVTVTLWKRALPAKIAIVIISAIIFDHYLYLDYKLGWVTFFRCFYGFFAGQILYDIYALPVSLKWQSTWGRAAATMAEAAVVVAVFLFMSAPGQGHLQMFAPILFAGVIYIFAPEAGWGSRLLATRPFDALGRYSYSVYMIHYLLIVAILNCLRVVEKLIHIHLIQPQRMYGTDSMGYFIHFGPGWLMVCLAVLILALVVFVSRWTYRLIEQPGQRFFAKLAVKSSNLRPSAPIVTG